MKYLASTVCTNHFVVGVSQQGVRELSELEIPALQLYVCSLEEAIEEVQSCIFVKHKQRKSKYIQQNHENQKRHLKRSIHSKGLTKLAILPIIGPESSNKVVVLKLKFPKNDFNKNFAPKLLFFIEKKKIRKIRMIFDIEN